MGVRLADSDRRLRRGWWDQAAPWAEYGLGLLVIFAGAVAAALLVAALAVLAVLLLART